MRARLEAEVMDNRLRSVLFAIVENYIETMEPVGSRTLSKALDLSLSPATIRNVMADLTEQGYLDQPHTSAGRVPTNLAYRLYVSERGEGDVLPEEVRQVIGRSMRESASGLVNLLATASRLLSELTQMTSVAASPHVGKARLRLLEFLRVDSHRIYAVLITQSNMVYHKIIDVSEDLSQEFLNSVSGFLNERFARRTLEEIRQQVQQSLLDEKDTYSQLLAHAVRLSKRALDLTDERELHVEGVSNLLRDFGDVVLARELLEALERREPFIRQLDRVLEEGGIQVAIGVHAENSQWQDCALVAATYGFGANALGAIGVIGPTRMNYRRVIPIVGYTAQLLTEAITEA